MRNRRKCDKCRNVYDTSPFSNMSGDGELAYSQIELYGDKFDLCAKCTREIYQMIKEKRIDEK